MGVSKLPKYEMYNNICNTQHTWSEQIAKEISYMDSTHFSQTNWTHSYTIWDIKLSFRKA